MSVKVGEKPPPGAEEFVGMEKCPVCGGPTVTGYGLAGGGCGPYTVCDDTLCVWHGIKEQDTDDQ